MIRSVVVTRVTRLFTELDVLHVRHGRQDPVKVLPRTQQLVQIFGAHFLRIFTQHVQLALRHTEHRRIGLIHGRDACDVFIHDLLQAVLQHLGRDVVGVDVNVRGVIFVLKKGTHRGIDLFNNIRHWTVQLRFEIRVVHNVLDHGFGRDSPFGE